MGPAELDRQAGAFYAAALGEGEWIEPLKQLCEASGASALKMGHWPIDSGSLLGLMAEPLSPLPQARWWVAQTHKQPAERWWQPTKAAAWHHSESPRDWPAALLDPQLQALSQQPHPRQRWHLCWRPDEHSLVWLALALPRHRQALAVAECESLQVLAWHLQQALTLHLRLHRVLAPAAMAPSILDRMQQPAWLLDGNAGVLLANAAARAAVQVRRELVQDGEGLKLQHASQHKQFLLQLALLGQSVNGSRALLPLSAVRGNRVWLCMRALNGSGLAAQTWQPAWDLPLAGQPGGGSSSAEHLGQVSAGGLHSHAVLVSLFEPAASLTFHSQALAQVLQLTPAQARVAALLAQGHTAAQVAAMLGSQESTVRTHQRLLLQKLCLTRKIDLVRMMGHSGWLWQAMAASLDA